jgi:hypothetical protein
MLIWTEEEEDPSESLPGTLAFYAALALGLLTQFLPVFLTR